MTGVFRVIVYTNGYPVATQIASLEASNKTSLPAPAHAYQRVRSISESSAIERNARIIALSGTEDFGRWIGASCRDVQASLWVYFAIEDFVIF